MAEADYHLVTPPSPQAALGVAARHLMDKPAFGHLKFGHWARILVGQVNRGHYLIIARGEEVVGSFGWSFATEEGCAAWLEGREIPGGFTQDGTHAVLNAVALSDPGAHGFLINAMRVALRGRTHLAFKRVYKSGAIRPMCQPISRFLERHVARFG
jgi:hypothetical protein